MTSIMPEKEKRTLLSHTLKHLLDELNEECKKTTQLIEQLDNDQLSIEQIEKILADLTASVLHLHIHTAGMDDLITEDLINLPDE